MTHQKNIPYITKGKLLDLLLKTLKSLQNNILFQFGPQKKQIAMAIAYIGTQQKQTHDFDHIIQSKEQINHELCKIQPDLVKYTPKVYALVTNNGYKLD